MVTRALVYLTSESEEQLIPDVQQLLDKLNSETFTEQQLAWLRALHAGDAFAPSGPVPALDQPVQPEAEAEAAPRRPLQESDVEEALRLNVLALNMFGEASHDLPASLARGDATAGHLGLWPEFSLLNHSCDPNAVNYTVGDRMVVRAAKDVLKGAELCINYLGRGVLRPTTERLLDLREGYSFSCACPRCAAEMDTPHEAAVGAAMDLHNAVMLDLVPTLQSTLGDPDSPPDAAAAAAVIASTNAKLQPLLASLETQVDQVAAAPQGTAIAAGGPTLAKWLRASAFEAYNLASQLEDIELQMAAAPEAAGPGGKPPLRPESPAEQKMLDLAASVAPGSDLHLFLAVKAMSRAQQAFGPDSAQAQGAQARALTALELRYGGGLSEGVQELLLKAASQTLERVAL